MIIFDIAGQPVTLGMGLVWALVGLLLGGASVLLLVQRQGKRIVLAETERKNLEANLAAREQLLADMREETAALRRTSEERAQKIAALSARLDEQSRHNAHVQNQMEERFRLLASDVLKSHGETFSRQNREQVENLLKPLREKIGEFQRQSHEGAARLAEQIGQLTQNSLRMSKEATDLTRALKGNAQTQGAWGEMILDSILAGSGLEEGKQYFVQQSHETGSGRVRTDVEVLFPNGDRMVVDSKVSLVAYEGFCNCDNEDQRTAFLRQHLDSMRGHIKALAAKDYHVHAGRGPEFVMMFIPIEAAFATAFSEDASLIEYAMKRNVYLTTPTTLMVALRTVRNVWDIEARNRNAEDIANRAGELYNKVAGFLTNMDKLDRSLEAARKSYDEARGQLVSGRGSVVRQVEMLQKLGARNSKDIPQSWKDMAESSISEAGSPEKDAPAESRVAEKAGPEGERLPKFLGTNRATPSRNKG